MRTVLALASALCVSVWISAQTPVPGAAATSKTSCLGCHEYDRVIAATADHMMPGGDKLSPTDTSMPRASKILRPRPIA
jgi:hypothetical protein